ncbi:MAG: KEOPS complex kinase/ATPase Bud32 [bacterium]
MNNYVEIGRGAEAVIYRSDTIVKKDRVLKKYRLSVLDKKLRKSRTKREAKVITKLLDAGLSVPKILSVSDFSLELEFISGDKLRDVLDSNPELAKDIGKGIAKIHNENIIHGDLTTSNMLYNNSTVYFIDFGLSQFSERIEDKAVDLHVLKQAMESYHSTNYESLITTILAEYEKECVDSKAVFQRLTEVEKRGRNKH